MNSSLFLEIRHVDTNIKKLNIKDLVDFIPYIGNLTDNPPHVLHSSFIEGVIKIDLIEIISKDVINNTVVIVFLGDMLSTFDKQAYMVDEACKMKTLYGGNDMVIEGPISFGELGCGYLFRNCDIGKYIVEFHKPEDYIRH